VISIFCKVGDLPLQPPYGFTHAQAAAICLTPEESLDSGGIGSGRFPGRDLPIATPRRSNAGLAGWPAHASTLRILHDVFLVVLRRHHEFRNEARITTWLFRITAQVVRWRRRNDVLRRWLWGLHGQALAESQVRRPHASRGN